jgi:hypothetical protein
MIKDIQSELYDKRHGGAWDRGSADSYYSRPFNPHYFLGGSYNSPLIELASMTAEEITAYSAGYTHNELFGDKKSWD